MKKVTFIIILIYGFNVYSQTENCEYVQKYGDDKPKGYFIGYNPYPFGIEYSIDFGLPETSKVSINIYDVAGASVFTTDCRLAGGKYYFNYGKVSDIKSGIYTLKLISELDWYVKSSDINFEGTKRIIIVK